MGACIQELGRDFNNEKGQGAGVSYGEDSGVDMKEQDREEEEGAGDDGDGDGDSDEREDPVGEGSGLGGEDERGAEPRASRSRPEDREDGDAVQGGRVEPQTQPQTPWQELWDSLTEFVGMSDYD